MLTVESSAPAVSQSSKSDGTEQLLSSTVNNDDVILLSSLKHTSEPTDVSDVKLVDDSEGDMETKCLDDDLPSCENTPAGDVQQQTDGDSFEELVSHEQGCVLADDSQRLSDVGQQLDAQMMTSSSRRSSILSSPDQSKLDHHMISSSLKNISQNEDQGLVYIVFSKPSSVYVVIAARLLSVTGIQTQFHVGIGLYFKQLLPFICSILL